jgi:predicted enzyme related to lactoylglutathione lyase
VPEPVLRVRDVVIDCNDHEKVVRFWSAALGWKRRPVNEQYVAVVPPTGVVAPALLFQKVPEKKTVKNRVHLDFGAKRKMEEEVARLVGLGAKVVAVRSLEDLRWTVLADPEGNEFCVSDS